MKLNYNFSIYGILILMILGSFLISGYVQGPKSSLSRQLPQPETSQCTATWQCSEWSECSQSGTQTRTCKDKNNCNNITSKPSELQECKPQITDAKSSGPSTIKIIGDSTCIDRTAQALNLLKDKATDNYNVVIKYVGIIDCEENWSGMYAWEDPPRFRVGKATIDSGKIWYAGAIAHDAYHSKLYHDYLLSHPSSPVPRDIYIGKNAEAQCLDFQYNALSKIGASQETLDHVKNSINSEYWNVTNRSW